MILDSAASIATIVLAIVASIGIYPWFKSLKQFRHNLTLAQKSNTASERASRIQTLQYVLHIMEDCRDARHVLEEKIAANPQFDVLTAPNNEKKCLDTLARSYDKLGALVKHGVAPIDFVMDFYSRPLVKGWQYLEPLITQERRKRNQPGHMLKFQILAGGAMQYRSNVYPNERSFDLPKEIQLDWETWSRS